MPHKDINALAKTFHWQWRARAYDNYCEQIREATRNTHLTLMENRHHKAATEIFDVCHTFLKDHQKELTPKTALAWMEMAVKLERMSLGIDAKAPSNAPSIAVQINNNGTASSTNISGANVDGNKMLEIMQILQISGAMQIGSQEVINRDDTVDAYDPGSFVEITEPVNAENDEVYTAYAHRQADSLPVIGE
jgi:hypothetical protein